MTSLAAFPAGAPPAGAYRDTPRSIRSPLRLPIEAVWQVAALVAPFIVTAGVATFTVDTWWALKMGQLTLEAGRPLVGQTLSFAPADPRVLHGQWLAHVSLYLLYHLGGELGLRLAAGALMSATFGLLLLCGRLAGGGARTTTVGAFVATLAMANNMAIRAQLCSYALFALTYALLHLRAHHPRVLYGLPLVFVVWANLHGAFLVGLVLVGLYAANDVVKAVRDGRAAKRLDLRSLWTWGGILLAMTLATCFSPLGPGIYASVWSTTADPSLKALVPEWQPTTVQDTSGRALLLTGALFLAVVRLSPRPRSFLDLAVPSVFGLLALSAQRNVVWWAMATMPILVAHASAIRLPLGLARLDGRVGSVTVAGNANSRAMTDLLNWVMAGLLVGLAVGAPAWRPSLAARLDDGSTAARAYAPADAGAFLAQLPAGARLYVFQPWSGYLMWRLWPAQQGMVDVRVEVHPRRVWDDVAAIEGGRADWDATLARYDVQYLVLSSESQPLLVTLAEQNEHWARVYDDGVAVVFARA